MCVCVCVYMYICVCVYVCVYVYMYKYIYTSISHAVAFSLVFCSHHSTDFLLYPSMPLLPTPQLPYSETWTHQNHRVPHESHHNHRVPHESHHRSIRILMSTIIPTSTNRQQHMYPQPNLQLTQHGSKCSSECWGTYEKWVYHS